MKYDIFENEQDRADARKALPELIQHPGWKFIERALEINKEHETEKLKATKNFDNLEQVYALQDRIDDFDTYKNLPDLLLQSAQEEKPEEEDSDPY